MKDDKIDDLISKLDPKHAALVFEQGKLPTILVPAQEDLDELVEDHVILCVQLAMAVQDKEIMTLIQEKWDKLQDEVEEEEKENESE